MSGVDELDRKEADSIRRRALCDVLDNLGADGVAAWHAGTPPDELMREISDQVSRLERREWWGAITFAAKKAGQIAAVAEASVVVAPGMPLSLNAKAEGARLCEQAILAMRQTEET